jgi:hypothetical protein
MRSVIGDLDIHVLLNEEHRARVGQRAFVATVDESDLDGDFAWQGMP